MNEFFSATAARIDRWRKLNRLAKALASGEGAVLSLRDQATATLDAKEIGSSVLWIGLPLGCAVSGFLLTVFGYVAMVMTK